MADSNAEELIKLSDKLFTRKWSLDSLRQVLANEFFPERANFTQDRVDGDEYMRLTYESGPALNRRTLADAIGALTRPKQQQWGKVRPEDERLHTDRALVWCDWASSQMHKLLYWKNGNFYRAMRMGDNDIVSFGDGVCSIAEDSERSGRPFFDWHHLRDCAWTRNRMHVCDVFHRKFKVEAREFCKRWGEDNLPQARKATLDKDPWQEVEVRHIVMPSGRYDGYRSFASKGKPFVSIYICPESRRVLKDDNGYFEFPYIVRPWEAQDYSPYSYSPAAMLGLCDARLLQSQAAVILDAAERSIDPPLIATQEAILDGPYSHAGSITYVDAEYDEKLGAALRPLETAGNLNIGLEMKVDTREVLAAAWYINKLNLPSDSDMTAYEVSERVGEYIRSIGPVIEPFEQHNQMILDTVFQMLLRLGKLGDYNDIPPEIRGADIGFEIEGPVRAAYARQKTVKARETLEIVKANAELDGRFLDNVDFDVLGRDAISGVGGNHAWLKPVEIVTEKRKADADAAAKQAQMEEAARGMAMAKEAASMVPAAAAANMAIPDVRQGMQGGAAPGNDNDEIEMEGLEQLMAQVA
jgi:hypothetical protein